MVITHYGISCFKVQSGELTLVFDPPSRDSEIKPPRFETNFVLSSHDHPKHNGLKELSGKKEGGPFLISGPGEYESEGISITGIRSFHDNIKGEKLGANTIYLVAMEDMKICHLGDLGEKELNAETLEILGEIDVLFVPAGGKDVLEAEDAVKVINKIEPKIAIPMHFLDKKNSFNEFLKEFGDEKIKPEEKFTFKKKELPEEGTRVVLLKSVLGG